MSYEELVRVHNAIWHFLSICKVHLSTLDEREWADFYEVMEQSKPLYKILEDIDVKLTELERSEK
ncbi:MAG: hypothetical protein HKN34_03015 [Gammaproteobacteria bacterium]|nr:hypothetical protein [Gammaproteobacteria bacterium]